MAALSACGTVSKVGDAIWPFNDGERSSSERAPEEGRISILTFEQQLAPDSSLAGRAITVPAALKAADWSQPGGVATNAPVMLRHGAPEGIAVWLDGEQKAHQAQIDELPRWATVAGWEARRVEDDDALPVAAIDVTLDAPELGGLVMVDTPGVGGVVAAHREIALEALARADALVFVLQSASPASRQEPPLYYAPPWHPRVE